MNPTHFPSIEPLEARIAPAVIVNPHKITFQDTDGDQVTVSISKGDLAGRVAFNNVFNDPGPQQLQRLDLNDAIFKGAKLTVTTVQAGAGNGTTDVGEVNANGVDFKSITISGDLAQVLAGDSRSRTTGLGKLSVGSFGVRGLATGADDTISAINGKLGKLTVAADFKNAHLTLSGGAKGQIGAIAIGGSLLGGATFGSGEIDAEGKIGNIKVTGSITGDIGDHSGGIFAGGSMGKVTIGGSLSGGDGPDSGRIESRNGNMGKVKITFDLHGGDVGTDAGSIRVVGKLAGLQIGGSVVGGVGDLGGRVKCDGNIGKVRITGDIRGGAGGETGEIETGSGKIKSVFVGGDLRGGDGVGSGQISCLGSKLGSVTIIGDFVRDTTLGVNADNGKIVCAGSIAKISIQGAINDARIFAGKKIGEFTAAQNSTGLRILAGYDPNGNALTSKATIGSVKIVGAWNGGDIVAGASSGNAFFGDANDAATSNSKISKISLGTATATASGTDNFGFVAAQVGKVTVGGVAVSLQGGKHNDQLVAVTGASDLFVQEV